MASKDHRRRLREIQKRIDGALTEAGLSEWQAQQYRSALERVIARLRPAALCRLHEFAREFRFYPSHSDLTAAVKKKYPQLRTRPGTVLKGMFDKDGTLHLDGGGQLHGRTARLAEFQAHELAHAIDGHRELSRTAEWREAWEAEIADGGLLGKNSAKSPHEGWGDFGMLVFGSDFSPSEIRAVLPSAFRFWRKRGLL